MELTFNEIILCPLLKVISTYGNQNAFFINEQFHTYNEFGERISCIRKEIESICEDIVGLVANDDLETYASIFALWMEGKCYVPLHPEQPIERCEDIIEQVGMRYILDSSRETRYQNKSVIMTKAINSYRVADMELPVECNDKSLAYILFTSGSTGRPKGVTISRSNIAHFIHAFWELGYQLDENDRCLQMFDLTFDLSVQSYLTPLLVGACVFTVPLTKLKYGSIFELIDEQDLTFALMVPSIIHHLRPYMDEINAPFMRYSLFCGEALPTEITREWSRCIPNARIDNVYGPTENTIYCTCYTYNRESDNKECNGVLCIGKAMKNTKAIIINESGQNVPAGEKGELCLSGAQLTPGYWNNQEKNIEMFFIKDGIRYYRTGDLCSMDETGDIMYHGRMDFQVKIQGYRIELGEIEHHARSFMNGKNAVAVAFQSPIGNMEIALFLENNNVNLNELNIYLRSKMPVYMIPSKLIIVDTFPLNMNGKIDRNQLKKLLKI